MLKINFIIKIMNIIWNYKFVNRISVNERRLVV